MMPRRFLVAVAIAWIALGGSVRADESTSAPAVAPTAVPATFPAHRLAWLPLDPLDRYDLQTSHPREAGRLTALARRAESLRKQLADPKLAPSAREGIEKQIASVDEEGRKVLATVLGTPPLARATPALLEAIASAADGPHAAFRHAMAVGAHVVPLEERTRALIEAVRARVEGALLSVEDQRTSIPAAWKEVALGENDTALRQELTTRTSQALDRQVRALEKRWWNVLDFLLTDAERATWFRALPPGWLDKVEPAEHLYDLPDLTPSQAARILSHLTEFEAEASPDQAAVRRVQAALREPGLTDDAKKSLRRDQTAAEARLVETMVALGRALRDLSTPEQELAYDAIPPRLSAADRRTPPERILERMRLTPAQTARLKAMRDEAAGAVRDLRSRAAELTKEQASYGPDAPQQMMMMAGLAEVRSTGARLAREALGVVFRDVLTEEQVVDWVLLARTP